MEKSQMVAGFQIAQLTGYASHLIEQVSSAQSKLRKYVERLEQSKTSRATEKKAYKEQIAALKAELRRLQEQQQSLPQNAPRNRQPEQERPSVPFQFRPPASNQTLFSTSSSCASDLPASRGHSGFSDRAKTPRMDFQQRTSAPIQGFGGANRTPLMNFQQQRPPNTGTRRKPQSFASQHQMVTAAPARCQRRRGQQNLVQHGKRPKQVPSSRPCHKAPLKLSPPRDLEPVSNRSVEKWQSASNGPE
ncbi:uncharacterized protein ISCGN_024196 [Ixodes scapularis]